VAATAKNFFRKLLKLVAAGGGIHQRKSGFAAGICSGEMRTYSQIFWVVNYLAPDIRKASRDVGPKDACHLTA
jgi:hypothetical protein